MGFPAGVVINTLCGLLKMLGKVKEWHLKTDLEHWLRYFYLPVAEV